MTTVEDLSLVQDQASMVLNGHFLGIKSNIDQNQPKWRIFDFCILCHVPCFKNVGFLGFSLLIFLVVASVSPNGHLDDPGTRLRCQMKNDLAKLRPNGKLDQNFQLWGINSQNSPSVFFFPFVWRFSNLPKNYKIFVFHLKNGGWETHFFLRKPIFRVRTLSFREASPMDALFRCFVEGFQPMISEDATCWRVGQGVLEEGSL